METMKPKKKLGWTLTRKNLVRIRSITLCRCRTKQVPASLWDDCVQDTSMRIIRLAPKFNYSAPFWGWVAQHANWAIQEICREWSKARWKLTIEVHAKLPDIISGQKPVGAEIEYIDYVAAIRKRVPPGRPRKVFDMCIAGGTYRKIGRRFGVSDSAIHFVMRDVVRPAVTEYLKTEAASCGNQAYPS